MKFLSTVSLALLCLAATLNAQNNAIPLVYGSLSPVSAAPGGPGFTLTVNGTGFVTGAVVNWNGSARATTVVSGSVLHATINATDISHAGTASVMVVNPTPGGEASNVVYFPVRQPAISVAFASEPGVSLLGGPVVAGDFSGDGKIDVAVAQNHSDGTATIELYRGAGDGTFASPVTSSSSAEIQSMMTGDFNGDGKLDLIVGTIPQDFGPAQAKVFLGNGAGHFLEKAGAGGGDFGQLLAVADLNGDGKLDVLFEGEVQGSGTVSVLLGNGDGTLTQGSGLSLNTTGDRAAIGDFNGDGKLDLAVPESFQVDIFLGNGDGSFQTLVPYSVACGNGQVQTADLDGDGKLDLTMGSLCVLTGNGDGTFNVGPNYGNGEGETILADFNGDGNLDVAAPGSSVFFFRGNGDGTFQPAIQTGSFSSLGATPAFGDFNRDGQLDVAILGNTADPIALQTALDVSPGSLVFAPQRVGTTSPAQTVTLKDVASHSVTISSIAISGANAADFVDRTTCGASIRGGGSCQVKIAFQPTAMGIRNASLTVTYAGVDSPQTVALIGTGR
jgi:hypothetical protein